jgi:hypothetical protein
LLVLLLAQLLDSLFNQGSVGNLRLFQALAKVQYGPARFIVTKKSRLRTSPQCTPGHHQGHNRLLNPTGSAHLEPQ